MLEVEETGFFFEIIPLPCNDILIIFKGKTRNSNSSSGDPIKLIVMQQSTFKIKTVVFVEIGRMAKQMLFCVTILMKLEV